MGCSVAEDARASYRLRPLRRRTVQSQRSPGKSPGPPAASGLRRHHPHHAHICYGLPSRRSRSSRAFRAKARDCAHVRDSREADGTSVSRRGRAMRFHSCFRTQAGIVRNAASLCRADKVGCAETRRSPICSARCAVVEFPAGCPATPVGICATTCTGARWNALTATQFWFSSSTFRGSDSIRASGTKAVRSLFARWYLLPSGCCWRLSRQNAGNRFADLQRSNLDAVPIAQDRASEVCEDGALGIVER